MKVRLAILLFLVVGLPLSMAGGTKDAYIAVRTDGLAGDGPLQNPFDGSTPTKLDSLSSRRGLVFFGYFLRCFAIACGRRAF